MGHINGQCPNTKTQDDAGGKKTEAPKGRACEIQMIAEEAIHDDEVFSELIYLSSCLICNICI